MWLTNTVARAGHEHPPKREEVFPEKIKSSCTLLRPLRKHGSHSCLFLPSNDISLPPFSLIWIYSKGTFPCKPYFMSLISLFHDLLASLTLCLKVMTEISSEDDADWPGSNNLLIWVCSGWHFHRWVGSIIANVPIESAKEHEEVGVNVSIINRFGVRGSWVRDIHMQDLGPNPINET